MTLEEAVERILQGEPFAHCGPCDGMGLIENEPCPRCQGMGSCIDPRYAEACQLLGRPLPENKKGRRIQFRNQVQLQKTRPERMIMDKPTFAELVEWVRVDKQDDS